ncbi:MAG: holo-ACP synthase [Bacteroidota bacterium]|nr:holo-ACP synthase [Bacteroidota bacterium]MDP4217656.1 holo-ACP synthase [Bacteroidota bacterium]MDP4246684.1 holo-ACP synthase [Bacteroidota bacterium]MDP4256378.1 holo-ACP synthase [Bacteroidota bacterium]MDP4260032.1 holo-ACP synthase [Bacteroidota bacterium]
MIAGLGIDCIEIERVAARVNREGGFRELIFSPGEIEYCERKADKFMHYAACFAAKEAFFKALGTGWAEGTAFHEVEIGHDELGRPVLFLQGGTKASVAARGTFNFWVSLSHLKSIATAVVIIEMQS